jgi:phage terminase large subunit
LSKTAKVKLPPKLVPVFAGTADYRGAHGGRGSAKTRSFALMTAVWGYIKGNAGVTGMILCAREFMNSLDDSSLEEVKAAIRSIDPKTGDYSYPWLMDYYEIGEKYVRSVDGRIKYGFCGLRHNLDSVKGKARILVAWVDEAETVSETAWSKLDATVREEGSEVWVTWNPESDFSATKKRFIDKRPSSAKIVELNWRDNPWFPARLGRLRKQMQSTDPDLYQHVWEGKTKKNTHAQIFHGKWSVREFEPDEKWNGPYFGLDFGFAQDPSAAVRCWVYDNRLWIEYEAGRPGLELDDTAAYMTARIPGIESHAVRADSARPESISFLRRHGIPNVVGVKKSPGSVEDGIRHIRSYEEVVIHPRCEEVQREFRLYSFKVDSLSGDVLPIVIDKNNHYIDAIRYALQPMISSGMRGYDEEPEEEPDYLDDYYSDDDSGAGAWKVA